LSTTATATAVATAIVTNNGGDEVVSRGFCWSLSNEKPTIASDTIPVDKGKDSFYYVLNGLTQNSTIYIRAYARNHKGLVYSSSVTSFKICPSEFEIYHKEGSNGAPVTKNVVYHSISSNITEKLKCWLTQNLGADYIPASAYDKSDASAGWYFQFNRSQGYQWSNDTRTPATWIASIGQNSGWAGTNDPCVLLLGAGWRLPTSTELTKAGGTPQYWQTPSDANGSVLKLHMAGRLTNDKGLLENRGSAGYYWSSTVYIDYYVRPTYYPLNILFTDTTAQGGRTQTAHAYPVRCLRD